MVILWPRRPCRERTAWSWSVTGNEDRVLLHARFDNLGKGASGAAIQCFNIMSGLEETAGLIV